MRQDVEDSNQDQNEAAAKLRRLNGQKRIALAVTGLCFTGSGLTVAFHTKPDLPGPGGENSTPHIGLGYVG
jgi:hypothetical protein